MLEKVFTVKYITSKNCFVYLSANNLKSLQTNIIKLSYGDHNENYFSVDPSSATSVFSDEDCVGINSLYAKILGIQDNDVVILSEHTKLPTIASLVISAASKDDYDILELLAENVQSTLLDQIRVLVDNQKFVIFIGPGVHVTVYTSDIKPKSPGCLDNFTEVVIQQLFVPASTNNNNFISNPMKPINCSDSKSKVLEHKNNQIPNYLSFLKNLDWKLNQIETDLGNLENDLLMPASSIIRLVPYSSNFTVIDKDYSHPFNILISKSSNLATMINTVVKPPLLPSICLLRLLNDHANKSIYVQLYIVEDLTISSQNCNEAVVSANIFSYFECQLGARAVLTLNTGKLLASSEVEEIQICTNKTDISGVQEKFKQYLADNCQSGKQFLLNSNQIVTIRDLNCFVRFLPSDCSLRFCLIDEEFLRRCRFSVVTESLPELPEHNLTVTIVNESKYCVGNVSNFEHIVANSTNNFICSATNRMENILIIGKSGTGKSTLLKIITDKLLMYPNYIYVKSFACKNIKGKTVESLHKLISTALFELIHHQPAALVLDDVHVLCESVNDNDPLAQDALYFNRVSEMLFNLFRKFTENNAIAVILTAESTSKLNKDIYASRGSHLIKNVFVINDLEKNDRKKLLDFFFAQHHLVNIDLNELALKTESFVVQDIVDFVDKTIFESYKEENNDQQQGLAVSITDAHCEQALKNTQIISLQNVNLHSPGHKDFSDIGGLHDVKKILIETMLWPIQYPNLFAHAPLRLQSGLLLYGPPGTGKTLLAGAAAKHCGLRLISIKGPELLSKYIGASEQAVRDVFQKAQSAKPCILFFDEFDSLAPRRGHDNTGVTDRVVNQLLTQLDGVESLTGVCVLAATSRPDLLDPALLRPGRLDRQILCALPNQGDRLDILTVLSKTVSFVDDIDLSAIASSTDGYSGADLQSILYTAQLACVDDSYLIDNKEVDEELVSEITQQQLLDALRKTRPSLTKDEKLRYDRIYYKFQGGVMDDFKAGSKATLA